jgi:hypothetical protein
MKNAVKGLKTIRAIARPVITIDNPIRSTGNLLILPDGMGLLAVRDILLSKSASRTWFNAPEPDAAKNPEITKSGRFAKSPAATTYAVTPVNTFSIDIFGFSRMAMSLNFAHVWWRRNSEFTLSSLKSPL